MTTDREEQEKKRKEQFAERVYQERFKLLKKGQEFYAANDIQSAVQYYSQYLNALAGYHGIDESKLSPKHIKKSDEDISELFLISHVYWDLAKAYDRSPKLLRESSRCLNQFIRFTLGFKYQYINARTLKNFIRKKQAHNLQVFKEAYKKIQVESKACFISSDLYGRNALVTQKLRRFKLFLSKSYFGVELIAFYYEKICPTYFRYNKYSFFRFFIRPFIFIFLYLISFLCLRLPDQYANH